MSDNAKKPTPVADDLSRAFWDGAKAGRLVIQRCASCGYYNHPPRPFCDACLSRELSFTPVSGRGRIHTFTVMHQRDVVGYEDEAPFVNIVVELAEQPMLLMVANVPAAVRASVQIGASVEVYFEDRGDAVIPQFRIL
ncbi:MAG TPA: zinc ribbon domain-containing protein [Candidatus Binataceae bacterium]|nr:zinc ribbon domain-containing protein [Candidatus Binataceae bacterium]